MNTLLHKLLICFTLWVSVGRSEPCDIKADAKAIVDSHFNEAKVAEILTNRTAEQCKLINVEVANINGGAPLVDGKYIPYQDQGSTYKDLLFALVTDGTSVLSRYLGAYFARKDETLITVVMLLASDIEHLRTVFNNEHEDNFDKQRDNQRSPFKNMMRVWAEKNREPDGPLPTEQEAHDQMMKMYDEQPFWDSERDVLESILMKKSCAYSSEVLKVYEKRHPGDDIEDDLFHVLNNNDLMFAYQCMAGFVKDRIKLWSKLLHQFCDSGDRWSVWIMIVTLNRGENLAKINDAFKKDFGEPLGTFVLKKKGDPTVIEMLAKLVDPAHKLNIVAPSPPGPPGTVPPP